MRQCDQIIQYLIKKDGKPFSDQEIQELSLSLNSLNDEDRKYLRNVNSNNISLLDDKNLLIVSGPGTGKSFLFSKRIEHWQLVDKNAKIFVTSFVRKLVNDLKLELSKKNNSQNIDVSSLHKFAFEIVKKTCGNDDTPLKKEFKVLSNESELGNEIWKDVLYLSSISNNNNHSLHDYIKQIDTNNYYCDNQWLVINATYKKLSSFYNVCFFNNLIHYANLIIERKPYLNSYKYFVIDEFQDFNNSEKILIETLLKNAKSALIAGDDDQMLYAFKNATSQYIKDYYSSTNFVKCLLPFCSRSEHKEIPIAAANILLDKDTGSRISKVYLPLSTSSQKITLIAVDHRSVSQVISSFINDDKKDIDERKLLFDNNDFSKDPFYMIIAPSVKTPKLGIDIKRIKEVIKPYTSLQKEECIDYVNFLKYIEYASCQNNLLLRELLSIEKLNEEEIHKILDLALLNKINLFEVNHNSVQNILDKSKELKGIQSNLKISVDYKIDLIKKIINIGNLELFKNKLSEPVTDNAIDDEELNGFLCKNAIELVSITKSKGLSAENVIFFGLDTTNMNQVTLNQFYVAMTRARNRLILLVTKEQGRYCSYIDCLSETECDFFTFSQKKGLNKKRKSDFINYCKWDQKDEASPRPKR